MWSAVLLLLEVHLALAAIHSHQYFYTTTSGIPEFPEFTIVGMVDGQQINYYDSKIKQLVPKQEWVKGAVDPDFWNRNTQIATGSEQVYINNIDQAKKRFNDTSGVHTYQLMYGCKVDDTTGAIDGFYEFGYDGEDFVAFDLKNLRWVSPKTEAFLITESKWNANRGWVEGRNNYLKTICPEWLRKYVDYGKETLQKTTSPQVSLLQKDSSSPVTCHATGFYPSGVKITWMKNGQEHEEDVDLGQLLPNEDGTFQRASTLRVKSDELKQYSCVVEHQGKTITENEIRTNEPSIPLGIIVGVIAVVILLVVIVVGVIGFKVYQKKGKSGFIQANTSDGGSDHGSDSSAAPAVKA